MVQAVGLLLLGSASSISFLGIGLTTAAGGLTLAGTLVNALALTALQSAFSPDPPSTPKPDNIKANSKVTTGDRFIHFGNVYVGGNLAFHRAKDGVSYLLFVHGHGEISSFDEPFLNAISVSLDEDGYVTDSQYIHNGRSRVRILTRVGEAPSAYFPEIEEIWPEWTPDHRLDGLSTTLMIAESVGVEADRDVYPNGDPQLRWKMKGTEFFDPRVNGTRFTDNAAVVMAGLMAHPDVFGRADAVDWDDVLAEALLCDIDVPLSQGGSEPRYRLAGSASLMEQPQNTLAAMMLATGSKPILKPSGKAAIRVGVWRDPVLTLTIDDLLEIQEIPGRSGIGEGYNVASTRYVDPELNFTEVDIEPYSDVDRIAEYGGELEIGLAPMLYAPSQPQARLAAKIKMERDNPQTQIRAFWRSHAIAALSEPFVRLDLPELGIVGTFEVANSSETYEAGGMVGVSIEFREFRQEAMLQDIDEQGEVQELPTPNFDEGVPVPQNVVAVGAGVQTSQNTYSAGIAVVWDEPVSDALSIRVERRKVVEGAGVGGTGVGAAVSGASWAVDDLEPTTEGHLVSGLEDGADYDVRVAFVSPSGRLSDYVLIEDVTANASNDPPTEPTQLTASNAGAGEILVSLLASQSSNLWRTIILRDGVEITSIVSAPGAELSLSDSPGLGTYTYTAQSRNVSDIPSDSLAGPVTVMAV